MTEPNEDTWERDDWDLGGAVELGREEVLRPARHLADQHARLRGEALAEVTDLERELRERAAEVAARELERLRGQAARASDELAARAATSEAEQQEVDAERGHLDQRARELDELKLDLAARAATNEAETEALAEEHKRIDARVREVEERE